MASVRIAVSIQESLLREADALAGELGTPRSRLLAMALREFIDQRKSWMMADRLRDAYEDESQEDELEQASRMKRHYSRTLEQGGHPSG